jgi:PAS domain S-box-containing protein
VISNIQSKIKKLRFNVIAIIFAVIFALLIPLWNIVFVPHIINLDDDFSYTADVWSQDILFDETTGEFGQPQNSKSTLSYSADVADGDILTITNSFHVKKLDGGTIFEVNRLYGIDSYTTEHTYGFGDRDRDGYLFGKPNSTDEFLYWHTNYDQALVMEYAGKDTLYDYTVNKFSTSFTSDQTNELSGTVPEVGANTGVTLEGSLEMWVDPSTGYLIKYSDTVDASFYDLETGEVLEPWNSFSNKVSEESVQKNIQSVRIINRNTLFVRYLPVVVFFLLLVFSLGISYKPSSDTRKTLVELVLRVIHAYSFVVLPLIIIMVIVVSGELVRSNNLNTRREEFNVEVNEMEDAIRSKINEYLIYMEGLRGLFYASENITEEEWNTYHESINQTSKFEGKQSLGYAPIIRSNDFENTVREISTSSGVDLELEFAEDRELYTPITYIHPLEENESAVGYDMFSEVTRANAITEAIDFNQPSMSGKLQLIMQGEEVQNGFVLYLPVYEDGFEDSGDINFRRASAEAIIASSYHANDFIDILESQDRVQFAMYDGADSTSEDDYYGETSGFADIDDDSAFTSIRTIHINNRPVTFEFKKSTISYLRTSNPLYDFVFGWEVAGIVFAFLLGITLYLLANANQRAQMYAENLNADLIKEKNRLAQAKAEDEAILENIGEGLIVTDINRVIIFANRAACNLLGVLDMDLIERKFGKDIPLIIDKNQKVIENDILETALKGQTVKSDQYLYSGISKTGFSAQVTVSPVRVNDKVIGAVVVFRDTTIEKEMDKAKSEFVSLTSHQMRTPLTTIKWYSQALLTQAENLEQSQKDYLHEIDIANQRMIDLVNSFLNMSQVERGMVKYNLTPKDYVCESLDILESMQKAADEKNITLKFSTDSEYISAKMDLELYQAVLTNLIINAIKYSPDNSTVRLSVTLENNKKIVISVEDRGIGIPKDEQKSIFNKMYRASNARSKETDGNGLGLYLVKTIVDNTNGKISFTSDEGGTVFTIKWPKSGMKPTNQ